MPDKPYPPLKKIDDDDLLAVWETFKRQGGVQSFGMFWALALLVAAIGAPENSSWPSAPFLKIVGWVLAIGLVPFVVGLSIRFQVRVRRDWRTRMQTYDKLPEPERSRKMYEVHKEIEAVAKPVFRLARLLGSATPKSGAEADPLQIRDRQ